MDVKGLEISLFSSDLAATLDFYVKGLLFTKVCSFNEYCTVRLGTTEITFSTLSAALGTSRNAADIGPDHIGFCISDIASYYKQVVEKGIVQIGQELELMMPGIWQFSVVDNNGYRIGFSQPD